MNYRHKILFICVVPLILSIAAITWVINYQTQQLSINMATKFEDQLMKIHKTELKNYTELALASIDHIYKNASIENVVAQDLARNILSALEYGQDGYFYVYTTEGVNVVHPKQPYRVDKDWWELRDDNGNPLIQGLISVAKQGGGYYPYLWEKPSSGKVVKKLGYTTMLDKWGWMVGTGVYIDDVDREVRKLEKFIDRQVQQTSFVILLITAIAVFCVFSSGLFILRRERKLADTKLHELTRRIIATQEEERRRVSRELHDGISQLMVAAQYALESGISLIGKGKSPHDSLTKSESHIKTAISDIRRISKDLHPRLLDDHGVVAAIESLAHEFSKRTNVEVIVKRKAIKNILPLDVRTTLYRVAQESLINIERHADATKVEIKILFEKKYLVLKIQDNGCGFDAEHISKDKSPYVGIGLRNMSERLGYHKGYLKIISDTLGTTIYAYIPKSILKDYHEENNNERIS